MPKADELNIIYKGTIRLQRTQKSDGGWPWNNPDTNPSSGVPTPDNTLGVTALGFLDAYRRPNSGPIFETYTNLVAVCTPVYNRMVTNSGDPSPSKHRIRGPDIRFLARLAQLLLDTQYSEFAKARWQAAKTEFGSGTATGFAQYIRDARKSQGLPALISWDIGLYVVSLRVLNEVCPGEGFDVDAGDMAEVIYNSLYTPPPEPTIDGVISPGEWGPPVWTITGSRANYNVYFVAGAEALYIAFEYLGDDPTITPPTVFTSLYIDGNNNSIIDGFDKALLFQNRNGLGGVVNWLRMYLPKPDGSGWDVPPNYDNPDEFGYRWSTPISPDSVPVKIGISANRKVVEWRIPRALVGAVGESIGLKWQAFDSYNWNNKTPALNPPPPDFDMSNQNQAEYWLGVTGALDAFAITGHHTDKFTPLSDALEGGQQPDGRWIGVLGGSDDQTTAYASVALTRAYRVSMGSTYPYPAAWIPSSVQSALDYLVSHQLSNGGFEYSSGVENTEVTSEVIQALCRIECYRST